jgi:hypothetical protein
LFANSEPGVWFDPSDLTTLFTDAAGTTPVTAVEQPVGLMLDKSRGLVLGSELVSNGDFSNGSTGWTLGAGWTVPANVLVGTAVTGGSYATSTAFSVTTGRFYKLTFNSTVSAGSFSVRFDNGGQEITLGTVSASGSYSYIVAAPDTSSVAAFRSLGGFTGTIDNISVRELPGNHAFQSVATTSRPVLSARYNLLTKSEQFDDGAWFKLRTSITANTATAPNGALAADTLSTLTGTSAGEQAVRVNNTITSASSFSVYVKKSNWRYVGIRLFNYSIFDLDTAAWTLTGSGETVSAQDVGDGWYRLSTSSASTGTAATGVSLHETGTAVVWSTPITGTEAYIWGASLVPANQASLPYQRVNTSTDYDADATKFPRYLRFDGSDDWLQTNTITPGTDKVQVFAGVRKLSDAARGVVVELSASIGTNTGAFFVDASIDSANTTPGAYYRYFSRGTTQGEASSSAAYPAPITNVLTGLGDISGDSAILRVNGSQAAISTADQGTGNYLAYPLYIGRRAGISLPFNGNIHQLIVRFGPNLDAATIANAEKFVGTKTGITL